MRYSRFVGQFTLINSHVHDTHGMKRSSKRGSVLQNAVLVVGMRWTDRLIGVVSTLILARLLAPQDFGIIAMASLFVQLLDMLMDLGVNVALIQNRNTTKAHFDSAWTLRLAQSTVGALATIAVAPLAAAYFNDFRLELVLQVMSIGFVLSGLENIWVVEFQKEMAFRQDVTFTLVRRLVGFVTTIVLALLWQSYWALVIGALCGRGAGVVLSYVMHPRRPSFAVAEWRSIFAVSQWMIVGNIGRYLDSNLSSLLVGRRTNASIMGGFSLGREISAMPTTELLLPLNRVLFPLFAQASHDPAELKRIYLLAQAVQCLVGIPAGIGLALVASEAVTVLLGERWLFIAPYVAFLALSSVLVAVTTSGNYVMITMGAIRNATLISWFQVVVFIVLAVLLMPGAGALEISWLRLITAASGFGVAMWMVLRTLQNVTLFDIARSVVRPIIASSMMSVALLTLERLLDASPLPMLLAKIVVGATAYSMLLILLWYAVGCPDGAERYVVSNARHYFGRLAAKIVDRS